MLQFKMFDQKLKKLSIRCFPKNLALFSVNLSKKRARDEKFGKNGGINQIFEFYCNFFTKYFRELSEKAKKLAFFLNFFSVV